MEKAIKRVIVEDKNKVCIMNNPLKEPCTIEELYQALKNANIKAHYLIHVDSVGTALVSVSKSTGWGR